MSALENLGYRVLGPLEIVSDGESIHPTRPKVRALLAYLLLHANAVVSSDRIVDALWRGSDPAKAKKALWVHVSNLRRILDSRAGDPADVLVTRDGGYELSVGVGQLDTQQFESLAEQGRRQLKAHPSRARAILESALTLWQGLPYQDLSDDQDAMPEIRRLEELRIATQELRLAAMLETGEGQLVVQEVESLTEAHPFRESLWALELRALYRSGQQTRALRRYQEMRKALGDEIGVSPSPELQRLEEQILLHDPSLDRGGPRGTASNLPRRSRALVGRRGEIEEVQTLVTTQRLVTLTGPGGVGKTALAIEAMRSMTDYWPDGVWLVELATVSDASLVPQITAAAVGLDEDIPNGSIQELALHLRSMSLVLIFDNCEHLLPEVAHVVERLLDMTAGVALLATSRESLRSKGEFTWSVPPLHLPDQEMPPDQVAEVPSVSLLCQHILTRDRNFSLGEDNKMDVVDVCRYLDGVPLALELAGAQIGVLGVSAVASRLRDHSEILTSSASTLERRHRSVVASITWSYELLSEPEQRVFDRISVFAGSFGLDDVEAVVALDREESGKAAQLLGRLVEQSMVQVSGDGSNGRRYRLLEVIKDFGRDRLVESSEFALVQERHAAHFKSLARAFGPELRGPRRALVIERVAANYEDFRSAALWSLDNEEPAESLQFLRALGAFWSEKSSYSRDGFDLATRMVDASGSSLPPEGALALVRIGHELRMRGDLDEAARLADKAILLLRDVDEPSLLADCLCLRGLVALVRDDESALPFLERALDETQRTKDFFGSAQAHLFLGFATGEIGDWPTARRHLERARSLIELCGGGRALSGVLGYLGRCALMEGELEEAARLLEQAIAVGHDSGAHHENTYSFNALAVVHLARGDLLRAASSMDKAFEASSDNSQQLSTSIALLAVLQTRTADFDAAVQSFAVSETIRRRHGFVGFSEFTKVVFEPARIFCQSEVSAEKLDLARFRADHISDDEAAALAREELRALLVHLPSANGH